MPVSLSLGVLCEPHGQLLVVELSLFQAQPWIFCSSIHLFHPHSLTHSFVQSLCWIGVHSTDLFLTCPVALCRLFVLGIGFFSLCFLMTSLGGQFSARRPGDSPFTIRTEGILVGKGESEMGAGVCGLRRRRPLNLATQGTP